MAKEKNVQPLVAVPQAPQEPIKTQNIVLRMYDAEARDYVTVKYKNIIGHQVGQQWVAVITSEDETLVFKSDSIESIRVWKE